MRRENPEGLSGIIKGKERGVGCGKLRESVDIKIWVEIRIGKW